MNIDVKKIEIIIIINKNSMVSKEVFKYPYCGQIIEEKVFFSDIVVDSTCKTIYVINQKPVSVISSFKTKTTTQLFQYGLFLQV